MSNSSAPLNTPAADKAYTTNDVIGSVIEHCIRGYKDEDGLIIVDFSELRDKLATAIKSHADQEQAAAVLGARIDELAKLNWNAAEHNWFGYYQHGLFKYMSERFAELNALKDGGA